MHALKKIADQVSFTVSASTLTSSSLLLLLRVASSGSGSGSGLVSLSFVSDLVYLLIKYLNNI